MPWNRGSSIAAVLAVAFACTSSGSDADPIPEGDLEADIAEGLCELRATCDCTVPLDADECRMQLESTLHMLFEPSRDAGLRYDADCAGRALAMYDELQCGTIDDLDDDGEACEACRIYYGTRARGESCTGLDGVSIYDDCVQGSVCVGGTCVDPCERSQVGQECLGRACVEGSVCTISIDPETQAPTSECVVRAGLGESCMELSCGEGLVCELPAFECGPAPGVGEPCQGTCDADSWCDTSGAMEAWVCRAPQADGEPCTFGNECASTTCEDGVCAPTQAFVCMFGTA